MVELNAESRLAPERRVATIARRPERAQRLAEERAGRAERRQLERVARADHSDRLHPEAEERGWWPMPDRPTLPEPISDQGAARFRADLAAYRNSMFLHEPAELLASCPNQPGWRSCTGCPNRPRLAKLPEDWPRLPR